MYVCVFVWVCLSACVSDPLSSGQDILFWQSNSMRELAEANPRLLSLSTLYPVAKEDFVLHLFYAHKNEEKCVASI